MDLTILRNLANEIPLIDIIKQSNEFMLHAFHKLD